ncbi:MAG TPA: hypothetical protein V6D14_20355 [Coleofasciculaceae cyanobacterium]|jgi:hypothetical protein
MLDRKEEKLSDTSIWLTLDFQKVQQRLNRITDKLEEVRGKPQPPTEAHDSDQLSEVEEDWE